MPVSSLTYNFDAALSATLQNLHKSGALQDQISIANAFFHVLHKSGAWTNDASGERMRVSLMYELGKTDSYSGYDALNLDPADGMTAAFFNWGQASTPIAISGKEERENRGSDVQVFNLFKGKVMQAVAGAKEFFSKAFLQGNGQNTATAITTAFTSLANGSVFIDPLPLLVHGTPTSAATVGNIAQGTYDWWRNQMFDSVSTTYAAFLKELDRLYNNCSKGIGGTPDLHVCDQFVYELYAAAMRSQNRYVDTKVADIPFPNVNFKGSALTWDQLIPDVGNGTITSIPVATSGTWYMLNTQYFVIKTFLEWEPGPMVDMRPQGQDAKTSTLLWHGGAGVSNRRKQGVMKGIDTTITT